MSFEHLQFHRLSKAQRWLLIAGVICVVLGFAVAASVEPDPRGFGTHQRFGLPPCTFQSVFNIACPSCGGTTAVAHFVRGHWIQSARCNLAVFLLALSGLLYLPWAIASLRTGYTVGMATPSNVALTLMIVLCGIAVIEWGCRLMM